jgi:hypothetical protein
MALDPPGFLFGAEGLPVKAGSEDLPLLVLGIGIE